MWVRAYPLPIDHLAARRLAQSERVKAFEDELLRRRRDFLILRVDRADLSKNVLRGFSAFDLFLEQHPEVRERVTFVAQLMPSRTDVPQYAEYLERIEALVAVINHRHGTPDWMPIQLKLRDDLEEAVAAYKHYDVLLVNAMFDGMNLVAKEGPIINERDGVSILSENTGAHEELGEYALSVNPFDIQELADSIDAALTMDARERKRRARRPRADHHLARSRRLDRRAARGHTPQGDREIALSAVFWTVHRRGATRAPPRPPDRMPTPPNHVRLDDAHDVRPRAAARHRGRAGRSRGRAQGRQGAASPPTASSLRHDEWGNRELAYPIRHREQAEYHLLQFHPAQRRAPARSRALAAHRRRGAALSHRQAEAGHARPAGHAIGLRSRPSTSGAREPSARRRGPRPRRRRPRQRTRARPSAPAATEDAATPEAAAATEEAASAPDEADAAGAPPPPTTAQEGAAAAESA